jgi:DNA-binding NarL/FixJ family response regulator
MVNYDYGTARAVVFERHPDRRSEIVAKLSVLGFEAVDALGSRDELECALRSNPPDLLVCGCDAPDDEICDILAAIRSGTIASNPFLIVVALSWCTDSESLGVFRNAGVDATASLPVSAEGLGEVVGELATNRKKFVATSNYIGPDRRRDPSRSAEEVFTVLNSLRVKSSANSPEEAERLIAKELEQSLIQVNAERLNRDVLQVCVLWRLLEQRRAGAPDFLGSLHHMNSNCDDIEMRLPAATPEDVVCHCGMVRVAIDALQKCLEADSPLMGKIRPDVYLAMEKLGQAALALADDFTMGAKSPTRLADLDDLVAGIDIRRMSATPLSTSMA